MSVQTHYKKVPRERFNLWYDLFKSSTGRFLHEPLIRDDHVVVDYVFECVYTNNEFDQTWNRMNMDIVESVRIKNPMIRLFNYIRGFFQ